jgi:hypothetical protein
MNWPFGRYRNAKDSANGARFYDRREGFIIVYTVLLRETPTNPTSFIPRESTIGVKFLSKDPFTRNYIGIGRTWN